ncbi:MAG: hypothetical protein H0V82_00655 [Candidatus Protochlamydia sp.]|nr:hypothetical protein [Candidatus Protochlamydia sp.]
MNSVTNYQIIPQGTIQQPAIQEVNLRKNKLIEYYQTWGQTIQEIGLARQTIFEAKEQDFIANQKLGNTLFEIAAKGLENKNFNLEASEAIVESCQQIIVTLHSLDVKK